MFDPGASPRVFGLPPGADFPRELVAGLLTRLGDAPPEALARVTILVNTRRMQRRLKMLLSAGPARLLPRILLVTELDRLLPTQDLPPPITPLRRRLELTSLVERLIDSDPSLAPRAAAVDLADSLAALMDEMQGEGVPLEALRRLDVADQSGHWERSLRFLDIVGQYVFASGTGPETRQRLAAQRLVAAWTDAPPPDPVIVAGSTGSRATTSLVMQAVATLPQGAVVLPGFDFHLPDAIWTAMADDDGPQDHPQFRFAALAKSLGLAPSSIPRWTTDELCNSRNKLISLSLRPAPVTDQWLTEVPRLGDLRPHTEGVALIEAPQPRDEANAIAVAIRHAVQSRRTVALITPDRTLGRRVAAALARWDIVPDDSAGRPLSLTAPGRFLRQVAGLVGHDADPVALIALLKHPLTFSGTADRGPHLLLTRELELFLRADSVARVTPGTIARFRERRAGADHVWCDWLTGWLDATRPAPAATLATALDHHIRAAETLAGGTHGTSGALWDRAAGRDALALIARFRAEADFDAALPFAHYVRLLDRALSAESTRVSDGARTDVMIWGTLEARVQGADVVILGGLNEGTWPEQPAADPWLNRRMRDAAGLLLPERQIGLSAHDFQQAAAARTVILSRARRDADSETVPSRWLSRLSNLLDGLPDQHGREALAKMKSAGQIYLDQAARLDQPDARSNAAPRPAPSPPRDVRPTRLVITDIQKLIRDPYAIYARYVLGLKPLDPLLVLPDARIRGTLFHRIVEDAFAIGADCSDAGIIAQRLRDAARHHLAGLPWPGVAAQWTGQIDSIADHLAAEEHARRATGRPVAIERKGEFTVPGTGIEIRGKADRIDLLDDGRLAIYDYKSGTPVSRDQLRHFDRQLAIEAVIAEHGGFADLAAATVAFVSHIGLGRTPKTSCHEMVETDKLDLRTVTIQRELAQLLNAFDSDTKGYPSRRAMEKVRFEGDYDHLARFGEWDATTSATTERLP